MSKGYIVRREIADNGPYGSTYGFLKVATPHPGETIYHGKFAPRTIHDGQNDADSKTVYEPVGEYTTSVYAENVEEF